MEVHPLKVKYFGEDSGFCPFKEWFSCLKDRQARAIIQSRLLKVQRGILGDYKQLKNADGVHELRIDFGKGLRIYFGRIGQDVIILLCGGDKGNQYGDIQKAKKYWQEARRFYA